MANQPTPWAGERTFHDVLYDWMERAPWLAISAVAHLFVFLVLSAIPWDQFREEEPVVLQARHVAPVEEFQEEPEPPVEPVADDLVPDEPSLVDSEAMDDVELAPSELESVETNPFVDNPSDVFGDLPLVGLGGGPPSGGHYGPRGKRTGMGGPGTIRALEDALAWLAAHQDDDGSWDSDGFSSRCGSLGTGTCDGSGAPTHDVGVTALALLAFLGDGHTQNRGAHRDVVARALAWLKSEQDPDSGLVGERSSHDFLYDHALATLALCEAYALTGSPRLKGPAQEAVNLIFRARNPYGAWRYDVPPVGDSDTSVTGWMVFALESAREAGLDGDFRAAFEGALSFLDEVSDPATGRVGYTKLGELSSRTPANEHFPRESGEAMTAVGLLCRIFLGQTPDEHPILARHAEVLRARPPVWDPDGFGGDFYYWYYGTYAMFQMGSPWWAPWRKAMEAAVVDSQRRDGDARGSWDPVGAWGYSGGRVYSTAVMTLSLEVYFRYARVLGAR